MHDNCVALILQCIYSLNINLIIHQSSSHVGPSQSQYNQKIFQGHAMFIFLSDCVYEILTNIPTKAYNQVFSI